METPTHPLVSFPSLAWGFCDSLASETKQEARSDWSCECKCRLRSITSAYPRRCPLDGWTPFFFFFGGIEIKEWEKQQVIVLPLTHEIYSWRAGVPPPPQFPLAADPVAQLTVNLQTLLGAKEQQRQQKQLICLYLFDSGNVLKAGLFLVSLIKPVLWLCYTGNQKNRFSCTGQVERKAADLAERQKTFLSRTERPAWHRLDASLCQKSKSTRS